MEQAGQELVEHVAFVAFVEETSIHDGWKPLPHLCDFVRLSDLMPCFTRGIFFREEYKEKLYLKAPSPQWSRQICRDI